jgi:ethanolamine utilization protein EutQ (cupin superfamily)
MIEIIDKPSEIIAAGNKKKIIKELIGKVNSKTDKLSIAKMTSPEGWEEPGQTPEFDEYTVVLKGCLHIESKDKRVDVIAGQAVIAKKNEWVKYSTPYKDGAEYIAVCLPAFSPEMVHRDEYKLNFKKIF